MSLKLENLLHRDQLRASPLTRTSNSACRPRMEETTLHAGRKQGAGPGSRWEHVVWAGQCHAPVLYLTTVNARGGRRVFRASTCEANDIKVNNRLERLATCLSTLEACEPSVAVVLPPAK